MWVCACPHAYKCPSRQEKSVISLGDGVSRNCERKTRVLGTELGSCRRAADAVNHKAVSLAPLIVLFIAVIRSCYG